MSKIVNERKRNNKYVLILTLILSLNVFASGSEESSVDSYQATIMIDDDIEIIFEVTDLNKGCGVTDYHYGVIFNVRSRSLSNQDYNINFNAYFYAALGTGDHVYGGVYNISNTSPDFSMSANNNGKLVGEHLIQDYPCENLKLEEIGLESVRMDYWGTIGSSNKNSSKTGEFTNSPLPIELTTFTTKTNKNNVVLEWETASELNNDFFTVERSHNGINFTDVTTIKGSGNSSQTIKYEFIDRNLEQGTYYYRLKQTDFDGKFVIYGPISAIVTGDDLQLTVFPNPSSNGRFTLSGNKFINGELFIYNSSGKLIYNREIVNKSDIPLFIDNHSGLYMIIFNAANGQTIREKILIN